MVEVQGRCIGVEIPAVAWITCLGKLRMITWNLRAMFWGKGKHGSPEGKD